MHHIYHTQGFVLASAPSGEANCLLAVFTRDLGMVRATASGTRLLKSKLRYSLQDFSYCDLALVRGEGGWRVTGASLRSNIFESLRSEPELLRVFGRALALVVRLCVGEEKNGALFAYLEEAANFAAERARQAAAGRALPRDFVRNFEYIVVLRVLASLGYLGDSPESAAFVASPYFNDDLLADMAAHSVRILSEINRSIKESQL